MLSITAPEVSKPVDPRRTGYTFNGWYKDSTLVEFPYSVKDFDETFVANWDINQYTVTFDANGGIPSSSVTQNYGTEVSKPADPRRTGYTFTGWYDGDQKVSFPYLVPGTNKTLLANWDINQYTITFVQGNGE